MNLHRFFPLPLVLALAACITVPTDEAPTGPYHESARYDILDGDAVIGTAEATVAWGDAVRTDVRVELREGFSFWSMEPQRFNVSAWHDAATGEAIEVETPEVLVYPIGPHRVKAPIAQAMGFGLNVATAWPTLVAPLGPQWALLAGSDSWGEASVLATGPADRWDLRAGFPCTGPCPDGRDAEDWTALTGPAWEFLPERIEHGLGDAALTLVLERTQHEARGARPSIFPVPLATEPVLPPGGDCGFAPCESAAFPESLSLQKGLEVMAASPGWHAHGMEDPRWFPLGVGRSSVDITTVVVPRTHVYWTLAAEDGRDRIDFVVQQRKPAGAEGPPVALPPTTSAGRHGAEGADVWRSLALPSADASLLSVLASLGLAPEQVAGLGLNYGTYSGQSADPRMGASWHFTVPCGDGFVFPRVSVLLGRIHYLPKADGVPLHDCIPADGGRPVPAS